MKASVRSALAVALFLPALTTAKTHKVSDFDWDTITPRDDLAYHDCYEEYKCARLQVPLNWLNESDARRATIAMIKLPAIVPETDKTFGGPIFTNPGGPGGSGVQQALTTAHRLRNFTATPGKRNFEIVSFDPRGIGLTVPSSDCFQTDKLSRDAQTFETRGVGRLDGGGNAIPYSLAMAEGTSRRCIETEMLFGEGMAYANTPSVARDMIAMLDRIYELRRGKSHSSTEEDRLELKKRRPASSFGTQPEGQDRDVDVPRLQYMGFSYGTILGNYFASLFPGRVGKLVLDGVSNADDYATGPGWTTNLVDTDKIHDEFFKSCFKAGHNLCPLVKQDDTDPNDIKARVWEWINDLDKNPLSLMTTAGPPLVITGGDIRRLIGSTFYKPYDTFRNLAHVLDNGLRGNITELANITAGTLPSMEEACALNPAPDGQRPEVGQAVLCSDGDDVTNKDITWWQDYVDSQVSLSETFGAYWSTIRFSCARWPFRPNWSFKGPFTTPKATTKSGQPVTGKPLSSILFLTNRLDPVTPLSAARAMSANHPDSRLVIQEAMGHCSVGNPVYKPCVKDIVAEYLYTGKLPDTKETICSGACDPWATDCPTQDTKSLFVTSSHEHGRGNLRMRRFPLSFE